MLSELLKIKNINWVKVDSTYVDDVLIENYYSQHHYATVLSKNEKFITLSIQNIDNLEEKIKDCYDGVMSFCEIFTITINDDIVSNLNTIKTFTISVHNIYKNFKYLNPNIKLNTPDNLILQEYDNYTYQFDSPKEDVLISLINMGFTYQIIE